jgi:glutamine amidotransferase
MESLAAVEAGELIDRRITQGRGVLGICVGMQVMFEQGVEHGVHTLGFAKWPGVVELLDAPILPHMGWNTVEVGADSQLFAGIEHERFYFVHSYGVRHWLPPQGDPATPSRPPVLTWARHEAPFLAAIEDGSLTATQFHPEKSGRAGHLLLRNWLATL